MLKVRDAAMSSSGSGGVEPIGRLVRRTRKLRGLTQYELADALVDLSGKESLGRDDVARWERGKRVPGPYWRHWLGEALDLPFDELDAAARCARRRR
ncbi:MAG: helix-turn-helix domain-containing protein [Pseudonocardiaceae bacterium]|nr:helix-turn-helix domain-containing protein [Pseudonocardiaceae bacterium]